MKRLKDATSHIDVEIGARIRAMRTLRGISQTALGEALPAQITFQQIQKYEKGSNRIAASTLIEICKILQCHPNDIIGTYFEEAPSTSNADLMMRMKKYENTMRDIRAALTRAEK